MRRDLSDGNDQPRDSWIFILPFVTAFRAQGQNPKTKMACKPAAQREDTNPAFVRVRQPAFEHEPTTQVQYDVCATVRQNSPPEPILNIVAGLEGQGTSNG